MDRLYFLLGQMTHLRYFIPLIHECINKGIKPYFLLYHSLKYNCPSAYEDYLNKICEHYKIDKIKLEDFNQEGQTILCVEPKLFNQDRKHKNFVYALTSQFDYLHNYDFYQKQVKKIIFPSKWFLENCKNFIGDHRVQTKWTEEKIKSSKNVFLGSPKYDTTLDFDKDHIIKKYNLTKKSKVLFFFPAVSQQNDMWITKKPRGLDYDEINNIYNMLRSLGFEVLVKSRRKHPIPKQCGGDRAFYDESWFPHTSSELIEVCDLVIMVDSTSIVECILQKTPFINIGLIDEKVRINAKNMTQPLLNYNFCESYEYLPKINQLKDKVKYLSSNNFNKEFDDVNEKYMFKIGSSSKKIINFIQTEQKND
jgi:hypothetical protein